MSVKTQRLIPLSPSGRQASSYDFNAQFVNPRDIFASFFGGSSLFENMFGMGPMGPMGHRGNFQQFPFSSGFDDGFGGSFGTAFPSQSQRPSRKSPPLDVSVEITLQEAFTGAERQIAFTRHVMSVTTHNLSLSLTLSLPPLTLSLSLSCF